MTEQPADSTLTTEKKLSLNWHSNAPWAPTGYGNQTKVFVPRIKDLGYPVSITAFYGLQGGRMWLNDGTVVYPVGNHPYGQDILGAHAMHSGANAIITLMDAWVVQPENALGLPWYPWFPIDCEPIPANVYAMVKQATKPIVMSKFGRDQAKKMGLDVYYVPHGVETKVFKPLDRKESRRRLGIPEHRFIIGMVAANKGIPPRKSFYEVISAFAAFHKMHPDALLYLHTNDGSMPGDHVDLQKFCKVMGLKTGIVDCRSLDDDVDVAFVDQYQNQLGIPDAYMVDIYNAMDVMVLVSLGEGFGIPLIEAQACGCPVITGEWTSMGELCFSGWKITKAEADPVYQQYFDAFQYRVRVDAVVDRMLKAYEMRRNQEYRSRARDGALAYDADKVTEKYWKPILADIEANLPEAECQAQQ